MKKEKISNNMKKVLAVALAATMAIPVATTSVLAATGPASLETYDFETGIEGILEADENAAVVNSETIYVSKTADELAEGEKLDANGLVYTGSGADAKYVTEAAIGTPTVIDDAERGKVLQFDDTTKRVDMFRKAASAGVKSDEAATKALDYQLPVNDYYVIAAIENKCPACETVNDGEAAVCSKCKGVIEKISEKTQDVAPALKVSNPFGGLTEYFTEYDELADVTPQKYGTKYSPLWTKGVTVSYWVKSTVDEEGKYEPASVLRWENNNQYYFQADNYAKYLTCKKFDMNYANMTDENKEKAFTYSPSGVFMYKDNDGNYIDPDGLMDYYFEYQKGYYTTDENGKIVAIMQTDEDGLEGPVYNYALIEEMNQSGTRKFNGTARFYFSNPNYVKGFMMAADGSLEAMYDDAYYNKGYNTLPTISEDGKSVDPGKSKVRYALEDGELQIDVDNSIFWVPDNVWGIDENPNDTSECGRKNGMQNGDVFFMNSWQESTVQEGTGRTYQSAAYAAHSPVTSADGKKNGNAGEWHHVAIQMQNDWVEFYVDGEKVDVYANYSSRGGTTLDNSKSFKRFNKGAGMRYGFGSEKDMGNIFYGNYVCRLFMDWLSDENSYLNFGGIGNYAYDYAQATTTAKVCMDDVKFFSEVLNDEQIVALYENTYVEEAKEGEGLAGDTDNSGKVDLTDAQNVLMLALGIDVEVENPAAADVDGTEGVALTDAQMVLKIALGIPV